MRNREGSVGSDLGSRASMRDDDIARAEEVADAARQAVGDLMRKIEQVMLQLLLFMPQIDQLLSP